MGDTFPDTKLPFLSAKDTPRPLFEFILFAPRGFKNSLSRWFRLRAHFTGTIFSRSPPLYCLCASKKGLPLNACKPPVSPSLSFSLSPLSPSLSGQLGVSLIRWARIKRPSAAASALKTMPLSQKGAPLSWNVSLSGPSNGSNYLSSFRAIKTCPKLDHLFAVCLCV